MGAILICWAFIWVIIYREMNWDKTMSKSDKDYVYDSLIDAQGIIDDLVEYMEADDTYEEDKGDKLDIALWVFCFFMGIVAGIALQATFTLLPNV